MIRDKLPLISVCIATCNQDKYIYDCVASVLLQRTEAFFDIEILVGNDASTDRTGEILAGLVAQYPGRVVLVSQEVNVGAAQNYLGLIKKAKGDYLAHLDGDDFWLPGKLLKQFLFMQTHPECVAVYSGAVVLNSFNEVIGAFSNKQPELFDIDYLVAKGNFLNHSSTLYRAHAVSLFNHMKLPYLDYELHIRLAKIGILGMVNESHVAYRSFTETSMLRVMPSHVRDLYLKALLEAVPNLSAISRCEAVGTYIVNEILDKFRGFNDKGVRSRIGSLLTTSDLSIYMLSYGIFTRFFKIGFHLILMRARRSISSNGSLVVFHPRI